MRSTKILHLSLIALLLAVGPSMAFAQEPPQQSQPPPGYYPPAPPPQQPPPQPPTHQPPPGYYQQQPPPYYPPATAPPVYPAQPQYQQPAARAVLRYEERPRYGLMIAGISTFGAIYLMNAFWGGYVGNEPLFLIPVLGPSIFAFTKVDGDDVGARWARGWLLFDTLGQATGVGLAIAGATLRTRISVYSNEVTFAPILNGQSAGLAAFGRF